MTLAAVHLWGRQIGAVSLESGEKTAAFEYDPAFAASGIQVSPLMMPLTGEIYSSQVFPTKVFTACPGFWPIHCPINSAMH
jgi:serine/threonine-protein kinase HipA